MKISLIKRNILSGIPSASGIEILNGKMYIMGDDAPCLFVLNEKLEIEKRVYLENEADAVAGRIPKKQKPDLEAMIAAGNELWLFGSGSKSPQRDILICVNTDNKEVTRYSLTEFYNGLCALAKLTRDQFNIEAAAISGKDLLLFNRGKNIIFKLNFQRFKENAANNELMDVPQMFHAQLPSINGIAAGFSGATTAPDGKLIFTASVENTPNWIDDGEVLGSFIGIFESPELKDHFAPVCKPITDTSGKLEKIKAESLVIKSVEKNNYILLLVTDTDGSASELVEVRFSL